MLSYRHFLKEVMLHVVAWIVTLVVIFPVTVTFALFIIFKNLVNFSVLRTHPSWTPLTAMDLCCSVFFNPLNSSEAFNNIGFTLVLEGDIDVAEVRRGFGDSVVNFRDSTNSWVFHRFRTRPTKCFGNFFWKPIPEERIDLNRLIKARSRVIKTDLQFFLSDWLRVNFDPDDPLWEAIVYKDDDLYRGKTVFVLKMSHVLGDGASISHMVDAMLGLPLNFEQLVNPPFSIKSWLQAPRLLLGQATAVFVHSDIISRQKKSSETVLTFGTFELEAFRTLATAHACKINDIVIAVWANALRRILLETGVEEQKLPNVIQMVTPRVISARQTPMTNGITLGIRPVSLKNPDRREKLQEVVYVSRHMVKSGLYLVMDRFISLAYYLPLFFVISTDKAKPGVSCSMSGFPVKSLSRLGNLVFGKYPVEHFYTLQQLLTKDFGFAITFITTCHGQVDATMVANRGVVPSSEIMNKFPHYVQLELEALQKISFGEDVC